MQYQDQYMEDKVSALGVAADIAKATFLPQYQYIYNPGMYDFWNNRLRLPHVQGNPLLGNPLSKFIGRKIYDAINPVTGHVIKDRTPIRKFGTVAKASNDFVSKLGLQIKDGYLSFKPLKESNLYQNLNKEQRLTKRHIRINSRKAIKLHSRLTKGSEANIVSRYMSDPTYNDYYQKHLDDMRWSESLPDASKAKNPKKRKHRIREQRIKNIKEIEKLAQEAAVSEMRASDAAKLKATNNTIVELKSKNAGLTGQKALMTVGSRTASIGVRAGMLAGKGLSYYAVGSLMWDMAKMITDPISQSAIGAINTTFNKVGGIGIPELGGGLNIGFVSEGAATERQRAVQAISRSRINGRSILGQEAMYMHA